MGIYLSKPNTIKDSHDGESVSFRFGVSAMQGWRMNMEDAHITLPDFTEKTGLFAVFDGHGGPEVAKFCAKYMPIELLKNENFQAENYKTALEEVFLKMDSLLVSENGADLLKEFKNDPENGNSFAGCTSNVVLITKTEIYVANAGDSRSYIFTSEGNAIAMSTDHKPDQDIEKSRIQKAGGYVSEGRVNDNLNLSRAIGDLEYKKNPALKPEQQIISAFPDVVSKPIEPNQKFVLIGCDGIWETLSAKDICTLIDSRISSNPTGKLSPIVEEVLDRLIAKETMEGVGCDNMSAIIVQLKQ
jgi:serine/threonine protein phosphatase PrpC